jgi:hypothetical protein
MATFTWIDGSDFNTADWELTSGTSSGTIPGPYDTANISGTSAAPVTVTVSSADEDAVNQINLTDATLAETGGSMTVGTLTTTNNDTLTSQLYALSISAGELTIQYGSTIGDTNPEVVGLEQTGGTVQFENDQGFNQNSYLVGGLSAVNQLQGTIEVDQGFLHIQGNSNFGGTLAGSAGSAENSGTIIFDAPTTYTFTNGAKVTVGQLEIGSGGTTTVILDTNLTYAGIFNVINNTVFYLNDTLTLTGKGNTLGGDITGGGTLVIARGAKAANNPNNGGFGIGGTATLDNKGTLTLGGTGGGQSIFIGDSTTSTAELLNDTTGTLTVTGGQQFVGQYKGELVNDGQMTVAGTGIVTVGADFWNYGTTTVPFGSKLQLAGDVQGGAHLAGTINGGGSVVLDGDNVYHLESGLSLSGVSLNMENGTLDVDASVDLASEFTMGSSTLYLQGNTLTLSGPAFFQYSTSEVGPGTLEVATGGSADIEGATFSGGAVLAVQGMVTTSSSGFTLSSATLQIEAGGVVDLESYQGIGGGSGSLISDAGTLELTSGSGNPAVIGAPFTETADGAVTSSSGSLLEFDGNGDMFAGAIDGAGTVELSGGGNDYGYTFNSGATISVANLEVTNNATLAIDASLTDSGALNLNYGSSISLGQNVEFTVAGSASLEGEVTGTGSATVLLNDPTALIDTDGLTIGGTATLQNKGLAGQEGNITIGDSAALRNDKGATYSLTGNSTILGNGAGIITNLGTFEETGGNGPSTGTIEAAFKNEGALKVNDGDVLNLNSAVTNDRAITATDGATVNFGDVLVADSGDTGKVTLTQGATASFASFVSGQNVTFGDSSDAQAVLGAPAQFEGAFVGFSGLNQIELQGSWAFSAISQSGGMTTLTLASGSTTQGFEFVGDYTQSEFAIASGSTTTIKYA